MKQTPPDLGQWPQHLRYVFDFTDAKLSRTVILSSYETFAGRTITTTCKKRPGRHDKKSFESKWKSIIGIAVMDEGHKLRHQWTISMQQSKNWELNKSTIDPDHLYRIWHGKGLVLERALTSHGINRIIFLLQISVYFTFFTLSSLK